MNDDYIECSTCSGEGVYMDCDCEVLCFMCGGNCEVPTGDTVQKIKDLKNDITTLKDEIRKLKVRDINITKSNEKLTKDNRNYKQSLQTIERFWNNKQGE